MTKAEKIYKDTKYACKKHIESWGFDNVGFNRMSTDELIYKRTVNDIKKLIEKDYKNIVIDFKFNIISKEEAEKEIEVLKMIDLTLKNQYIA